MSSFAPRSDNTVRVRIFDTTLYQVVSTHAFLHPVHKGQETLNLTTVAFLVENERLGKRVLFDSGGRKDFQNFHPSVRKKMDEILLGVSVEKDTDEILETAGVPPESIDSLIWSHWHFDHHGCPDHFPKTTEIVVGPGFEDLFLPGFPTRPDSILSDAYFKDREVREISFQETSLKIGSFPAIDFFGDGSFYLLDSPGHAVGHICGFARTTPDTFVFMGGDICHSPGIYRPTSSYPLPDPVPNSQLDPGFPAPCPCLIFTSFHPSYPNIKESRTSPFFELSRGEHSTFIDRDLAAKSVKAMRELEEAPNVFICIAHDMSLLKILPLLNTQPGIDINDWQARGYKEMTRWYWLNELPRDGKPAQPPLVEGRFWRGQRISKFTQAIGDAPAVD